MASSKSGIARQNNEKYERIIMDKYEKPSGSIDSMRVAIIISMRFCASISIMRTLSHASRIFHDMAAPRTSALASSYPAHLFHPRTRLLSFCAALRARCAPAHAPRFYRILFARAPWHLTCARLCNYVARHHAAPHTLAARRRLEGGDK